MKSNNAKQEYVAFLRGINVGGHHKVPMAELKEMLRKMKFGNIITLLNSGNIIFEAAGDSASNLEKKIAERLEKTFGFPVPTIIRRADVMYDMWRSDPFQGITLTKDTRFYISFLRDDNYAPFEVPWKSLDDAYQILEIRDRAILSVLDISALKTPKAMAIVEKHFGKDITTRNWNTIGRICQKLDFAN